MRFLTFNLTELKAQFEQSRGFLRRDRSLSGLRVIKIAKDSGNKASGLHLTNGSDMSFLLTGVLDPHNKTSITVLFTHSIILQTIRINNLLLPDSGTEIPEVSMKGIFLNGSTYLVLSRTYFNFLQPLSFRKLKITHLTKFNISNLVRVSPTNWQYHPNNLKILYCSIVQSQIKTILISYKIEKL